jgi:hypothetical protein
MTRVPFGHAAIVDLLSELGSLRLDKGNPTGALAAGAQAIAGLRQAIVER